ncbi:protein translocase subunit SecF [Candidatus Parcubacteria bacterium]|nr:MAG: protein translocase subunit SecF [Candidatus Parcubacteria bacterium]
MFIIKYRKIWYVFSGLLVAASLFAVFNFGLKQGIDFTGGSLLEVEYASKPDIDALKQKTESIGFGSVVIQPSGEKNVIFRLKDITEDEHQKLVSTLVSAGDKEVRFDSIGPVIGKELKRKSITAIILVIVMIVLYIAFAFRKVSRPVSSFYYGLIAIVALIHDVALPAGVFAVMGYYYGVEVDMLFVTALLTVLGFSVHDTIVVFDRIRENLKSYSGDFPTIVGTSISQTITRSINTSLTVILVLLAMFFLGGESTKYFSLALLIGVGVGTYSSIFLASPLLVTLHNSKIRS